MTEQKEGPPGTTREVRRAAVASVVGSALEWYDFFLYGTAAALVFNTLFFPTIDPVVGTVAAFGTNAVGFLARPIGGMVFGHFGDRLGRKSMLVITLVMMGVATFLIGVLPTYEQLGLSAAVLLVVLRVVQGIAAGGEWGGAVLIISEHAPARRRGFFSAWSQTGVGLGFVLSTGAFALVSALLTREQLLAWGWRLPFLVGIVLTLVGLLIRMRVMETPAIRERGSAPPPRIPALEAVRRYPRAVLVAFGARIAENGATYIFLTFSLAYARQQGLDGTLLLGALVLGMLVESFAMPVFGALSDRIGRRPVYVGGAVGLVVWAFPYFALLSTGSAVQVYVAVFVAVVLCHGAMIGTQPAFFSELFDSSVRYSGVAIGHELASVVAGGLSPIAATALLAWSGASWPVALLLVGMGAVTIVAVVLSRETTPHVRRRSTWDDPVPAPSPAT